MFSKGKEVPVSKLKKGDKIVSPRYGIMTIADITLHKSTIPVWNAHTYHIRMNGKNKAGDKIERYEIYPWMDKIVRLKKKDELTGIQKFAAWLTGIKHI